MTKRYSDTLRERAEVTLRARESLSGDSVAYANGSALTLIDIARELDSPEFSGRIVYEQRNAALEDAKRWEAEATRYKRAYETLRDAAKWVHDVDELDEPLCLAEQIVNGTEGVNTEETSCP